MHKFKQILKKIVGYLCIIECFVGIGLTTTVDGAEKVAGIITVALFALFAYLCFKKPKRSTFQNTSNIVQNTSGENAVTEEIVEQTDRKFISDEEIPNLIQLEYEQILQNQRESTNPKFHRSLHEENLSFDFITKYEHQVSIYTNAFETLYRNAHYTNDLNQRISLLKQATKSFKKAKRFCYSKGKGGKIYFQDMWEFLHNSQKDCFSYLDMIQDSLNEAIYLKNNAIPRIINIVRTYDGILQKDIYDLLPDINKSTIQRIIKKLDDEKAISRKRKGNSYELHKLT